MLGITNYYHRKKLQFALQAAISSSDSNMDRMSCKHVCRWLDDIGLPQYQDKFEEACIDGRMLHYLTVVIYLLSLHYNSLLWLPLSLHYNSLPWLPLSLHYNSLLWLHFLYLYITIAYCDYTSFIFTLQ